MTGKALEMRSGAMQTCGRVSTFHVADLFFGIDVLRVQEVLRYQPMTRVPRSPQVIEGLMNLRGQIVMAIDMRRLLHFPRRADEEQPMNVVIRTEAGAVSLLVDEIGDVLELDNAACEPPPANLAASARKLIGGVYKLEERLMLMLDPDQAVDLALG